MKLQECRFSKLSKKTYLKSYEKLMKILQIFENQAPASQPNICTEHSLTYVNLVLQTAEKVVYAMRAHNAMSTYKHIVLMTFTAAVCLSHYHRKQSV